MKSIDDKIIFANNVLGIGFYSGNFNVTLGVALFTPTEDGKSVNTDLAISARLRLDEPCARQLAALLNERLRTIDEQRSAPQEKEILN